MARIEHFAVFGADLERLKQFYVEVMGLRVIVDNSKAPTAGYFLADDHGTALEVIARPPGRAGADTRYVCHTAFLVADYDTARRDLEARGVEMEGDSVVETEAMRTCFFRDPEGNRCQIVWRARPLGE